ncbi:MAG: undecaprenyl/decaprenyl-phosphate alpha-N-acetylglucosaminyl 1-phosphate transferase [Verrucomicrobiaceae bacterium]|nr:undecaprenyl/decaprenyl-phosphate alpha-N-acetylglucosaminyl 1-phosphate transferase [Verrucomicrobiaceae bacterium]
MSWLEMGLYFGGALLVAALGTWWILKNSGQVGLDAPDHRRKLHEKAVPRLGGGPIFLAVGLACLAAGYLGGLGWSRWLPVAICNALMFSVGFVDDLKPQGAKVKLIGQIGTALILYALGVSIDTLSNPFGEGSISLGWWGLPITLMWLVSIPNIINLIDGMDGLAGGFGLFLCLTLAFIGYYGLQPDVLVVALAMAGALAGFLIFNLPPAKIFLGDGGAYLIGFFIASVSLFTSNKGSVIGALLVIIMALGVPILDTLFAIIRRAVRGVPIFNADAEHIHHRLILRPKAWHCQWRERFYCCWPSVRRATSAMCVVGGVSVSRSTRSWSAAANESSSVLTVGCWISRWSVVRVWRAFPSSLSMASNAWDSGSAPRVAAFLRR